MTNSEEEGGKGSYLRVWVRIDITKPLSRVRKVWSEGKVIGWASLKYERLPNFCYWCGNVAHDDRDCKQWLQSRGTLSKSEQHYGDWMRAEVDLSTRKASILVPGAKPTRANPSPTAAMEKDDSAKADPEEHGASSSAYLRSV